jgi:hypothetical protein
MDIDYSDYPPFPRNAYGRLDLDDEPPEITAKRTAIDNQIANGIIRFLHRPENLLLLCAVISCTHQRERAVKQLNEALLVSLCYRAEDLARQVYNAMDVDHWIIDASYRQLMFKRAMSRIYMRIVNGTLKSND